MKDTKIKICGMMREEDIAVINQYQPDYVGFIIDYPKSDRSKTQEEVKILTKNINPKVQKVGVFVDAPIQEVIALATDGAIDIIQLHGNEDESYIAKVHKESKKPVVKAYIIRTREDVEKAKASKADMVLLDCGRGSGQSFPWEWIPEDFGRPYILAGGLSPENLEEAYQQLHPWAMDISSGVETNGWKDENKIKAVMQWREK